MEIRKVVGQVTPEESAEIQALFERKNGLAELAKIINADNNDLYEKLVKDMGETSSKFQQWWDEKALQYGWESHPKGNWEINFQSGEITLVIKEA
jgi:CXXX repeat modification system protein